MMYVYSRHTIFFSFVHSHSLFFFFEADGTEGSLQLAISSINLDNNSITLIQLDDSPQFSTSSTPIDYADSYYWHPSTGDGTILCRFLTNSFSDPYSSKQIMRIIWNFCVKFSMFIYLFVCCSVVRMEMGTSNFWWYHYGTISTLSNQIFESRILHKTTYHFIEWT
jgi:hypothetical protein